MCIDRVALTLVLSAASLLCEPAIAQEVVVETAVPVAAPLLREHFAAVLAAPVGPTGDSPATASAPDRSTMTVEVVVVAPEDVGVSGGAGRIYCLVDVGPLQRLAADELLRARSAVESSRPAYLVATDETWHAPYASTWVLARATTTPIAAPATFEELIDPRFDDRLVVPTPDAAADLYVGWFARQLREGHSEERVFAWLATLDARAVGYADDPADALDLVAAGRADFALVPAESMAPAAAPNPTAVGSTFPAGDVLPARALACAAGNATDPAIADRLLAAVVDPDFAHRLAERCHLVPTDALLPDARTPAAVADLRERLVFRPAASEPRAARWFATWERRVRGRGATSENLDSLFDLMFAAVFLGFVYYVYRQVRRRESEPAAPRSEP